MLCQANVHLSEWPLGERRDVPPTDERIQGLLRAGYIVPVVIPRSSRAAEQEAAVEPAGLVLNAPEPEPPKRSRKE